MLRCISLQHLAPIVRNEVFGNVVKQFDCIFWVFMTVPAHDTSDVMVFNTMVRFSIDCVFLRRIGDIFYSRLRLLYRFLCCHVCIFVMFCFSSAFHSFAVSPSVTPSTNSIFRNPPLTICSVFGDTPKTSKRPIFTDVDLLHDSVCRRYAAEVVNGGWWKVDVLYYINCLWRMSNSSIMIALVTILRHLHSLICFPLNCQQSI